MALHNQVGIDGEKLAELFLLQNNYEILYKNWRYWHYEIDIICLKEDKLHIVEVKTLSGSAAGYPEQAVTKRKFKMILKAADEFLFRHPHFRQVQYDVLAITLKGIAEPEIFFIEDVWF